MFEIYDRARCAFVAHRAPKPMLPGASVFPILHREFRHSFLTMCAGWGNREDGRRWNGIRRRATWNRRLSGSVQADGAPKATDRSPMHIFFASHSSPQGDQLPQSQIWDINLCAPLTDLGHEVTRFHHSWITRGIHATQPEPDSNASQRTPRAEFSESLLEEVQRVHQRRPIDLFFSYFYSSHVEPDAIREISRMGIPTLNWYCNASYQFHLIEELAPAYDFCMVPEKFRLEDYRRVGANPIYCQEAANPNVYKPYDVPQQYDVTFVGQKYGTRPEYLWQLYKDGIDVRAWGTRWCERVKRPRTRNAVRLAKSLLSGRPYRPVVAFPINRCGPPLSDEQLIKMYSRSRVSLGFTAVAEVPADGSPAIKQVRLRDFEATMSGAFYMVEHFQELAEFFEPDKEIVFFHDAGDLIEKAKFYLRHDAERNRIRQAGLRRALAEHTWHQRFEMVFDGMQLPHRRAGRAA